MGQISCNEIMYYDTAANMTLGKAGHRLDSDGVKLFASTAAKEIADSAIQVMGGYGYVGEYHVERLWRDSKLLEIGGGTVESHQKNIVKDLFKNPRVNQSMISISSLTLNNFFVDFQTLVIILAE